mmetsp:Transcript_23274/g.41178  ORF Transcript_23274/g.41178 Transcript_23274/m.41178 type:complete len:492 (+) Transcript_23274:166-1641(+)|eukprot:CAMPEP_0197540832 /NCGR_PEP_ID=MMETSP1318-20131121/66805_1 /TAXON_ID=552666 /ORGANISM="Partenskyella glossopodia, Strain RCC365" /LENGTH=491 /DNA_ID=CAMNT_0043099937 /DNA_START=134 /DNA_END=1609 /DNA_ORIENTATION=-
MGNACSWCFLDGQSEINESTPLMTTEVMNQMKTPNANSAYMPPTKFIMKYELRGVLGAGATGLCHICIHHPTRGAFACKIVRKRRLAHERKHRVLKQLRTEVDVLKKLNHPNIVQFKDFFEDRNNLFIVMELVGGGELFQQVVEAGSFSEKTAATVVRDVASGLSYMHKMGVIHRDLKPENLLVPGPGLHPVKICDFGLAFQYGGKKHSPKTFVGSPRYMAPEQMQRKAYNSKVDTWALGVILFILLSGCLPFEPAMLRRSKDEKLPVRELALKFEGMRWFNISWDAKTLIFACLNLNPDIRFSADQVLSHSWLDGSAPSTLIRNSEHLRRYLLDKRSNGSFFLEPNTLGHRDIKTKIAATHRNKRSHPMSLNRGYNTPDESPQSSPTTSSSKRDSVMSPLITAIGRTPREKSIPTRMSLSDDRKKEKTAKRERKSKSKSSHRTAPRNRYTKPRKIRYGPDSDSAPIGTPMKVPHSWGKGTGLMESKRNSH